MAQQTMAQGGALVTVEVEAGRDQDTEIVLGELFGDEVQVRDAESPLWVAWMAARTAWLDDQASENTRSVYLIAWEQFFAWAGVAPWDVSVGLAQEWKRYMLSDDYVRRWSDDGAPLEMGALAESSVNAKLAALTSFYSFVAERYRFRSQGREVVLWPANQPNPFRGVKRLKVSPYGRAEKPSTEELQAMLAAINTDCLTGKRDFALIYTAATTCRRFSEFISLRWGDLEEMDDGNFWFPYVYKGGDLRKAVLTRLAYQAICAYLRAEGRLEEMQEDEYIFRALHPGRGARLGAELAGLPVNRPLGNGTVNGILKKYARRVGVDESKAHIHGIRHAGLKLRVQQMKERRGGVDYVEVMEVAGHSTLAVTQIYVGEVCEDPSDPGAAAAARALMPKGRRHRKERAPEQAALEI